VVAVVGVKGCMEGSDHQMTQRAVPQGVEGGFCEDYPLSTPVQVAVVYLIMLERDASDDSVRSHAVDSLGANPHDGIVGCRDAVEPKRL